jgi:aryl-alcohol dehydrogenase-like predicted oxidoreductase
LNFQRKARAEELGHRLGKDPIQIALAYVLHQPWPVIPLIGPASLAELRHSLAASAVRLSPEEVRWLENGERA